MWWHLTQTHTSQIEERGVEEEAKRKIDQAKLAKSKCRAKWRVNDMDLDTEAQSEHN